MTTLLYLETLSFQAGLVRKHSEQIDEELPTYIDELGRTIKICPTRWAGGISPLSTVRQASRSRRRSD
jgi:hypothetical protein